MTDTLTLYYALPAADTIVPWGDQTTVAAEIFGASSSFSGECVTSMPSLPVGEQNNLSWQGATVLVVLLALFCYTVYRFGTLARTSIKSIISIPDTISLFDNSTLEFNYFIKASRLLFLLTVAIMIDGMIIGNGANNGVEVLVIMLALIVAATLSTALIKTLSFFDHNTTRWGELRSIKKIDRSIAGLFLALPSIVLSYSTAMQNIALVILAVALGAHFLRLLIFFKGRGFSFLQSILYLCAVEIAPFALLWGVASRLNGIHT